MERLHAPSTRITRRHLFQAGALGAFSLGLSACGASSAPTISLFQSKPEVIPYFRDLVSAFNADHPSIHAVHDATTNLSASFARGTPPDLGCLNYNLEMARFQERGELSDLSDIAKTANIAPSILDLVDQYPSYPGRTSVIPYSMMGAATFYNKDLFDKYGVEIPTTYSELLAVCEKFKSAGVTAIYLTSSDSWTLAQGITDYSLGGALDVADFFKKLRDLGPDANEDSEVSFSKDFKDPLQKAVDLLPYTNSNAASRKYADGNVAFANGEAAMYLQGPWAITEIMSLNPQMNLGIFPLPMTENSEDRKVRVNLDLALWVPEQGKHKEEARELLKYLIQPEISDKYNAENNGFGVRADSPEVSDASLKDLQTYIDKAAFYQGVSTAIPKTIPFENYVQSIFTGGNLEETLATLDKDWQRTARRQSAN